LAQENICIVLLVGCQCRQIGYSGQQALVMGVNEVLRVLCPTGIELDTGNC